ncbi:MAG: hypothetical protein IJ666_06640 [Ruminococcus sp.]|nr:hypothetical protein [Ruminococcus sp.]
MENVNIKRVNGMGKACRIISRIAMVFCIIGAVFMLAAVVFVRMIPADKIHVTGTADAKIELDFSDMPISEENAENIMSAQGVIEKDKIKIDNFIDLDYEIVEIDENQAQINISGDLSQLSKEEIISEISMNILSGFIELVCMAIVFGFAASLAKSVEKSETPFTEEIIGKMKKFGYSLIPLAVFGGITNGSLLIMALLVLVIIMVINIFAYGAELQKQSDETV